MQHVVQADVVVVGAGACGTYAASRMAQAGLQVVLIDRCEKGQTGAQWVNSVPVPILQQLGLLELALEASHGHVNFFWVASHCGTTKVGFDFKNCVDVDMRLFGSKLLDRFLAQPNARFIPSTHASQCHLDAHHRLISLQIGDQVYKAPLFVDASGFRGVLRRQIPAFAPYTHVNPKKDLCTAVQEVYAIDNLEYAHAFLEKHNTSPGDVLGFLGVAGGFSLLKVHISKDCKQVSFLTGATEEPYQISGRQVLNTFLKQHPFVGKRIFGGQRAIPLRRPYALLASDGIALIGDSASQVYAAHGSGTGIGLLAADMLAQKVIDACRAEKDIGAIDALWKYQSQFHAQYGFLLYSSDLLRQLFHAFNSDEIRDILGSGLVEPTLLQQALEQKMVFGFEIFRSPVSKVHALFQNASTIQKAVPTLMRLAPIAFYLKQYPSSPNFDRLLRFEKNMQHWMGNDELVPKRIWN